MKIIYLLIIQILLNSRIKIFGRKLYHADGANIYQFCKMYNKQKKIFIIYDGFIYWVDSYVLPRINIDAFT